jgi:hypothetical protein
VPQNILAASDLTPFISGIDPAKAAAMVQDATAMASLVAPCILEDDFPYVMAARAILRGAVLRWHEAGTGAFQSTQTGPFGAMVDTRQQRRGMFWPSEIEQLQSLCATSKRTGKAFDIDTTNSPTIVHADICALNFGAEYCSCGAVLTGLFPLAEYGEG